MAHPRFIYYNDAHHFHAKRIEPPASEHMLQWPVDELAGTGADTLVLGLGYGDVYFHDSKVGRVVGQGQTSWGNYIDWRIMRMVEEAGRLGTDQLRTVVERGRELGTRVVPSLKLQDPAAPGSDRAGLLKQGSPEGICIGEEGRYLWGYDFMHDAVHEDKLAVLREVFEDYGPDGIELDFMFDLRFFKTGEVEQGTPRMTQFVAEVRRLADEVGEKKGRRFSVSARVSLDEERNRSSGLDVGAWIRSGHVDWVCAQDERVLTDTQPKPSWLPDLAADSNTATYYRPPRRVYHEATGFLHIEMSRALRHTLLSGGWNGLYHGYMPWPLADEQYQFLREMAYPETTCRRDKRYFLQPREGAMDTPTSTPDRQLPIPLEPGTKATVQIQIADDVESARQDGEMKAAELTLRIQQMCADDEMSFRFNDQALYLETADITDERAVTMPVRLYGAQSVQAPLAGAFHWLRFRLPAEWILPGSNTVEVEMVNRDERATFSRELNGVELYLRYRDMQRPHGLGSSRLSPLTT
ncbi:MAG TPA: hypothetical protein DGN59_04300 [Candidatus Latescibacteria bacterium]|nr:hypothetical protein [Candidatus Latescibacterota bacterium]